MTTEYLPPSNRGTNHGKGRSNRRSRRCFQSQQHQWSQFPYQQTQFPYEQALWTTPAYLRQQQQWAYPWQSWPTTPCQYSTTGAPRQQSGILGPKPLQAHMATAPTHINSHQSSSSYAPTDNQAAMHTFSSPDNQWYMDTGATSHMTAN
ncbi:hypothetical protein A2U01_0029130, partial [Trifolium medium]|nr:hypothetical protein [Trifolium medium]